jgi:AraC-like DNA-binding protein
LAREVLDDPSMTDWADWARFEQVVGATSERLIIDRLHVQAGAHAPRSWSFVSYAPIVIHARSPGVSIRHPARSSVMTVGGVVVLSAFDAQLEITAAEGASFQVLEEIGACRRARVSQVKARLTEPTFDVHAHPAEVFVGATEMVAPLASVRLSRAVERTRSYIEANVASNFSLETLGAAASANRYDLCRLFQRQVGLPPHRFRAHLRVARARELLASGLGCTKVAHAAGFCDQSHLNRAFKELTGTTPGAYARVSVAGAWVSAA